MNLAERLRAVGGLFHVKSTAGEQYPQELTVELLVIDDQHDPGAHDCRGRSAVALKCRFTSARNDSIEIGF